MKKQIARILCLALALGLTACGGKTGQAPPPEPSAPPAPPSSQGESIPPKGESVPPEPETPASPSASPEPEEEIEGALAAEFTVPVEEPDGGATGETVTFTLWFPDTWRVEGEALYNQEDVVVAEVAPAFPFTGPDVFDRLAEKYPDGDPIEVTLGGLSGKYYYVPGEVSDPAFATSVSDDILYCLEQGEHLLCIKFHPLRGAGGISGQREQFQGDIKRIR